MKLAIEANAVYEPLYRSKKRYVIVIGGRGAGRSFETSQKTGTNLVQTTRPFRAAIKRNVTGTIVSNAINMAGYGDVVVASDLTATSDGWSALLHQSYFGVIGAIDLIVQIDPNGIEFTRKEKGHADIWKALLGMGAKMFEDGQLVSVVVKNDASLWK